MNKKQRRQARWNAINRRVEYLRTQTRGYSLRQLRSQAKQYVMHHGVGA